MSFPLNDLNACQLLALANALAIGFSKDLTTEEIDLLGILFTAVGDLLALIAQKQENLEESKSE